MMMPFFKTDEQIASIQEEIGFVYEHIEELSKGKEDGRSGYPVSCF